MSDAKRPFSDGRPASWFDLASRLSERRRRGLLFVPSATMILCFQLAPVGIIVVFSFLKAGTYGGVVWEFSYEAYVRFLFDRDIFDDSLTFNSAHLQIIARSLLQASFATVACLLLGFPTAYYMATRPPEMRNVWVLLITIPFWTNLLIRTFAIAILLRERGPINSSLLELGLISAPIPMLFTNFAIGLGLVYSYLPFMVLPLYASMEKVDFRLVEASYDLYASRTRMVLHVLVPLVKPGIVAGCFLVFIPSIGSFLAPDILGGGKNLMFGSLIQLQFTTGRNWPFGSAIALILLSFVLLTLMAFAMRSRRAQS